MLTYRYTFIMPDDRRRSFELSLDPSTLELQPEKPETLPEWTRLSCSKCSNCPLDEETHPYCPIAANITDLVGFFADVMSFDEVDVEVGTDERSYVKRAFSSEAVSSLLGIYMVTSGCPIMDKLRPMVRFHLPLATGEETTFRAVAVYLVAQYFLQKNGVRPDWELKGLHSIYDAVQIVNRAFVNRLREASDTDASINAVIRLDALASSVVLSIDMESIDGMEALFEAYLSPEEG